MGGWSSRTGHWCRELASGGRAAATTTGVFAAGASSTTLGDASHAEWRWHAYGDAWPGKLRTAQRHDDSWWKRRSKPACSTTGAGRRAGGASQQGAEVGEELIDQSMPAFSFLTFALFMHAPAQKPSALFFIVKLASALSLNGVSDSFVCEALLSKTCYADLRPYL